MALARRYGLSEAFVGATIVGFGTSAPEFLVSLDAVLAGAPKIALGNVVGSNLANSTLIIGTAALIAPLAIAKGAAVRDAAVGCLAAVLLLMVIQGGGIGRLEGVFLLLMLAAYLFGTYRVENRNRSQDDAEPVQDSFFASPWRSVPLLLAGIVLLVFGAEMLVNGAVALAKQFGISQAVIGLTLVAVGTSLPELATAIVAALKRSHGVVIGNVLGSNIFNIFCILGGTAAIAPIAAGRGFSMSYPVSVVAVSVGVLALVWFVSRMSRLGGFALVAGYLAFIALQFHNG